jgi:hypothetical protein
MRVLLLHPCSARRLAKDFAAHDQIPDLCLIVPPGGSLGGRRIAELRKTDFWPLVAVGGRSVGLPGPCYGGIAARINSTL